MRQLLLAFCTVAVVAISSSSGHSAEKLMPIDFVGEWCTPEMNGNATTYTLPSWTEGGKCADILSVEKWGFTFNDTKQAKTCLPDSIRLNSNTAPSGTAYIATINAHCVKDGVTTRGSGTPQIFEFQRYKGKLTIKTK